MSQIVEVINLPQLRDVLVGLAALQAPSVEFLLRRNGYGYEADVVKAVVAAIRGFPWDEAVTFAPLPGQKPTGGFLEVGAYDGGTYAWENSVSLVLGSNGRVYAEVTDRVMDLPDVDDEGRPLDTATEDNHTHHEADDQEAA